MNKKIFAALLFPPALCIAGESEGASPQSEDPFSFGADLRIRQEIMNNVPGLPGGGVAMPLERGSYRNHVRFRPRVWGEFAPDPHWKAYVRLADEFRWCVRPRNHSETFPGELIVDNLFLEATDLFDDFLDFKIGRQDIYGLYGLDHVFVDGTPGDGSRSVYSDVARGTLKFDETERLDLFMLYDKDDNAARFGTRRSKHKSLSGLGGGAEPEMDDWGWGAVYSGNALKQLPWQVFAMQKNVSSFHRRGVKHPRKRRELLGVKLMPRLTDEVSLQFEAMGQVGRDGEGDWLSGWSTYAGVNWKKKTEAGSWTPFANFGVHTMSGDKNAADEDGGNRAWDPMWSRGVNDSELFLYGTHYGAAWWSNMVLLKANAGIDFGRNHRISAMTGPLFAARDDGMGGGDGCFKGYMNQIRYDFPILPAGNGGFERFEIVGHVYAELFNPGDYFRTDRPSWFLRWQVEFRF